MNCAAASRRRTAAIRTGHRWRRRVRSFFGGRAHLDGVTCDDAICACRAEDLAQPPAVTQGASQTDRLGRSTAGPPALKTTALPHAYSAGPVAPYRRVRWQGRLRRQPSLRCPPSRRTGLVGDRPYAHRSGHPLVGRRRVWTTLNRSPLLNRATRQPRAEDDQLQCRSVSPFSRLHARRPAGCHFLSACSMRC